MRHRPPDHSERGIALLAVLWLLLLLAVIAGSFMHEAKHDRELAATEVALAEATFEADGAINHVIETLIDPRHTAGWRLDGTPAEVDLFGRSIEVEVESEAGKIDIGASSPDLLAAMFRTRGLASADADTEADRVVAWRAPAPNLGPDPAADPYIAAGLAYRPRHGAFRSVGELRLVVGMTDALQTAIAPLVTVYSRNPSVDRQVAGDAVLRVLEEAGDGLAESQRSTREQGQAAGVGRPVAAGEALTIRATIHDGVGMQQVRTAVVRLTGDRRQPVWVMAWN